MMRATDEAMEQFADVDFAEMLETMGKYNDDLIRPAELCANSAERALLAAKPANTGSR